MSKPPVRLPKARRKGYCRRCKPTAPRWLYPLKLKGGPVLAEICAECYREVADGQPLTKRSTR